MEKIENEFGDLINLYIIDGKEEVIFYLKEKNIDENEIEVIIELIKDYIDN